MIVEVSVFPKLNDVVTVTSDASDVVGVARVCPVEGNNSSTDDGKTSSKHTDTIEAHCHFEYRGTENVAALIRINVITIIIDDKILRVKLSIIMRSVY